MTIVRAGKTIGIVNDALNDMIYRSLAYKLQRDIQPPRAGDATEQLIREIEQKLEI